MKANYIGVFTADLSQCSCDEERVAACVEQIREEYEFEEGVAICIVPLKKMRGEDCSVEIYEIE